MINEWERFFETGRVEDYLSAKRTEAVFAAKAGEAEAGRTDRCKDQYNTEDGGKPTGERQTG